jgi:hypothetical protein
MDSGNSMAWDTQNQQGDEYHQDSVEITDHAHVSPTVDPKRSYMGSIFGCHFRN